MMMKKIKNKISKRHASEKAKTIETEASNAGRMNIQSNFEPLP